MIDIVSALLSVSRIELGTFGIKLEEKKVCAIVEDTLLELKPAIDKAQLKLKTTFLEKKSYASARRINVSDGN